MPPEHILKPASSVWVSLLLGVVREGSACFNNGKRADCGIGWTGSVFVTNWLFHSGASHSQGWNSSFHLYNEGNVLSDLECLFIPSLWMFHDIRNPQHTPWRSRSSNMDQFPRKLIPYLGYSSPLKFSKTLKVTTDSGFWNRQPKNQFFKVL